jgi:hypothetical protein
MAAKNLRVRVCAGGQTRADLTFPARAAESLADLMPEHVAMQARARGLDIDAIAQRATQAGLPAGELFSLDEGGKQVRVWLE